MVGKQQKSGVRSQKSGAARCSGVPLKGRHRVSSVFCLLTSVFLLSFICCSAFASSWTRQPSGTMAWLHAVYFLDQDRGWIAGANGTLLSTVDGGATWTKTSF